MSTWERIVAWCEKNAPATKGSILPPLSEEDLNAAQRGTGGWNWPEDVLDFFWHCNGLERSPSGYLFPHFRPLSLHEVVFWWEHLLLSTESTFAQGVRTEFTSDLDRHQYVTQLAATPPSGDENLNANEAGSPTGRFIGPWLPIAEDQSGGFLVVDRRRGPKYGCLIELDKVDVDLSRRQWRSLSQLLEKIASAMETRGFVEDGRNRPEAGRGRLVWSSDY